MEQRRIFDTSILRSNLKDLYDPNFKAPGELFLYDHPDLLPIKSQQKPVFRVFLTRLEPRIRVYEDADMQKLIGCSEDLAECTLAEIELYDTASLGHLMCIGVGRYPHNLLRPFVGENLDTYYQRPENFDPLSICAQVSRDHGLIFLNEEADIYFRDFGTKKHGRRLGSKNGTWINGDEPIQDLVVPWSHENYLGIGGRIWVRAEQGLRKEHVFKLRYEKPKKSEPSLEETS